MGKLGRVIGFAEGDEPRPYFRVGLDLPHRFGLRADPDRLQPATPAGKLRRHLDGGRCRAVDLEQFVKGDRADVFASDQAEPVEAFFIGKRSRLRRHQGPGAAERPILGSSPLTRRRTFA